MTHRIQQEKIITKTEDSNRIVLSKLKDLDTPLVRKVMASGFTLDRKERKAYSNKLNSANSVNLVTKKSFNNRFRISDENFQFSSKVAKNIKNEALFDEKKQELYVDSDNDTDDEENTRISSILIVEAVDDFPGPSRRLSKGVTQGLKFSDN